MKVVHQECVFLSVTLQQTNGTVEFSFQLCHCNDSTCYGHVVILSLFDKEQGRGNGDVEASHAVGISADIDGLDLPAVFIDEIAEYPGLFFTKAASWADEKYQGMIIAGAIDCLEYFIVLHADPRCDAWSCSWVHMVYIKELTIFLGDVHGGIGIGEGFTPGGILHGQIFQDVLLGWALNRFFLQDVQEFLKIIRMHIPQIIHCVTIKRWGWPRFAD